MPNFRNLVFVKNATNTHGQFKKGDRAQGRFSKALIESYLKAGILAETDEPVALEAGTKDYTPRPKRKKADA